MSTGRVRQFRSARLAVMAGGLATAAELAIGGRVQPFALVLLAVVVAGFAAQDLVLWRGPTAVRRRSGLVRTLVLGSLVALMVSLAALGIPAR